MLRNINFLCDVKDGAAFWSEGQNDSIDEELAQYFIDNGWASDPMKVVLKVQDIVLPFGVM